MYDVSVSMHCRYTRTGVVLGRTAQMKYALKLGVAYGCSSVKCQAAAYLSYVATDTDDVYVACTYKCYLHISTAYFKSA